MHFFCTSGLIEIRPRNIEACAPLAESGKGHQESNASRRLLSTRAGVVVEAEVANVIRLRHRSQRGKESRLTALELTNWP
jgi:hypothetical protein